MTGWPVPESRELRVKSEGISDKSNTAGYNYLLPLKVIGSCAGFGFRECRIIEVRGVNGDTPACWVFVPLSGSAYR